MTKPFILVIGYGNTLRSDDGVGYRVAEAIAEQVEQGELSPVRSLSVHQLTPELADDIAQAERVIFVDAAAPDALPLSDVQVTSVTPALPESQLGHSQDVRSLLHLAQQLYGRVPQADWLLVPAEQFDFGETFSAKTQRGFDQAIAIIRQLIQPSDIR